VYRNAQSVAYLSSDPADVRTRFHLLQRIDGAVGNIAWIDSTMYTS